MFQPANPKNTCAHSFVRIRIKLAFCDFTAVHAGKASGETTCSTLQFIYFQAGLRTSFHGKCAQSYHGAVMLTATTRRGCRLGSIIHDCVRSVGIIFNIQRVPVSQRSFSSLLPPHLANRKICSTEGCCLKRGGISSESHPADWVMFRSTQSYERKGIPS